VSADVFGTVSRGAAFGLEPSARIGRAGVGRFGCSSYPPAYAYAGFGWRGVAGDGDGGRRGG
jgi:hypothetical protein